MRVSETMASPLQAKGPQHLGAAEHHCGAGGGPILRIREVPRERQKPATNADVWLVEGSCNALYTEDSPICAACWMAYLAPIGKWCRSLGDPSHFHVPLAVAIRQFPVARCKVASSSVVYNQLYGGNLYTESVGFWYERDAACTKALEDYATAHGLAIDMEPGPPGRQHEILVSATFTRRV